MAMTVMTPPRFSRLRKWMIYTAITIATFALVFSQLPRGPYSTDLSRIGQGQPSLVLAYDIKSMGGMAVMEMMDELYDEYTDRINFLVADFGVPQGQAFGRRFDLYNGSVVLLSAPGLAVNTLHLPFNTAQLKQALEDLLALDSHR
jgi:hypothetical protein